MIGGEAGLPGQDRGRGGEEDFSGPSLDPVPEAVHNPKGTGVRGKEVGPLGKNGEKA